MKKFFPFLFLNYCLIHYAVLPGLGGKIIRTISREIAGTECRGFFFCNPLWRTLVAGWTAPLQSQLDTGILGYFTYSLELVILNFLAVLVTCFFFFNVKKWRFTVFAICVVSCFIMIPVPNRMVSQYPFLQFLIR